MQQKNVEIVGENFETILDKNSMDQQIRSGISGSIQFFPAQVQLIMSHPFQNTSTRHQYLTEQEIERRFLAKQAKFDLFDTLLHQHGQSADAESSAKVQTMDEEPITSLPAHQHHGCRCSKIGCLKLYCECFANGRICGASCECSCCRNKPGNQVEIYQAKMLANLRHPGHFKGVPAMTPTRKCTCKKSMCQKRYCECYSAGLKCTQFCQCKDCQNGQPHVHEQDYFSNMNDHMMEVEVRA